MSAVWLLPLSLGAGAWLVADALLRVGWPGRWTALRRRLTADSSAASVIAASGGGALGAVSAGWVSGSGSWSTAGLVVGAWLGRFWLTSSRKSQRMSFLLQQKLLLPEFLDRIAISVGAGLGLRQSVAAAAKRSHPLLAAPWLPLAADEAAEKPLAFWLDQVMRADPDAPSSRVASQLLIATERGTPVAAALAALSQELRSEARRELLEQAARKDVQMMLPVVFGILPSVTVVALYPALTTLSALN